MEIVLFITYHQIGKKTYTICIFAYIFIYLHYEDKNKQNYVNSREIVILLHIIKLALVNTYNICLTTVVEFYVFV
jgi:hypothetical protein